MTAALPTTQPQTERARVIASIHALAEYLAEHPEIPTPTKIDMSGGDITETDEADEATRVAGLLSWSKANGGTDYEGSMTVMSTVRIMCREAFGLQVEYTRHAFLDRRNGKGRYVK